WRPDQRAGGDTAQVAMHEQADVAGELLGFRSGKNHEVIGRMQKARFRDPALLFDELAMHDRDLSRRAAEAYPAELPPVAQSFAERWLRRRHRGGRIGQFVWRDGRRANRIRTERQINPSSSCTSTSSPAATFPV